MRTLSATLLVLSFASCAFGDQVELLDFTRVEGAVKSVSDKHVVIASAGRERKIEIRDVAEVKFSEPPDVMSKAAQHVLVTAAGDMFAAAALSVEGGQVSFETPDLGQVRLPVEAASVFYQPIGDATAGELSRKAREMKLEPSAADLLVAVNERGDWLTVNGLLKAVGPDTILFRWKDDDRTVKRETVRAIFFGRVARWVPGRDGVVIVSDGSVVGFESLTLAGETAAIRTAAVGERKIPRGKLAVIRFESDRVVELADLKPDGVNEYGVFETFPHRVNASVGGGPIRLGGRIYATGLGLHSFCELSYELAGRFSTFVATVGIDDTMRPRGDAVLTFLGDGRQLAEPLRLTGKDKPTTLRLNVSRVRVMTIRVDFGQHGLDSGDHVDLAAARLIK